MLETETIYDVASDLIRAKLMIIGGRDQEAIKLTDQCINDLQDICIKDNICPFCGGEIIEEERFEDCGSYVVRKCKSCEEEF